ncbi:helix-turn-helix domain containing protein [Sphingobium sp. H39-3-25]|uniref:TetR/AcrR family transcriptional regulator n=1 Tax=Sphingobium arseniciresistens TaxID=3030834 RepID=UPI0023B904C1|nr:helix-turn-helix domain containing protein [Sphingobium arseniciresistens]
MERISAAALSLFAEHGYDSTTMRDVARHAKVALGTLSLYATDKRDLTLLVFNEQIAKLTASGVSAAHTLEGGPLSDRLAALFSEFYIEWEKNATLARIFLQVNFYSRGMHSEGYQANRRQISLEIEYLVKNARATGEISSTEDAKVIAQHFFFLFSSAARSWIAEDAPVAEDGIAYLHRLIRLQVQGLGPAARSAVAPEASVRASTSRSMAHARRKTRATAKSAA